MDGIQASVASWIRSEGDGLRQRGMRAVGSYVSPKITILRGAG